MCKLARLVQVQAPLGSHGILAGAYSPHHQPSHSVLFTPDIDDSQVQPLRIHKGGTPIASPTRGEAHPRPLSDISPTEHRRNSPSFKQTTKVCNALFKLNLITDCAPLRRWLSKMALPRSSPLPSTPRTTPLHGSSGKDAIQPHQIVS